MPDMTSDERELPPSWPGWLHGLFCKPCRTWGNGGSVKPDQARKWRWKLWGLACRSPRVCPSNAYSVIINGDWRHNLLIDDRCRQDCAENGACWCARLVDEERFTERYPGADIPGRSR